MIWLWVLPLFLLQLYACALPLFGHFGSYQAVNAMMAEMFRYSLWEPRVFSLVNGKPGLHLLYIPYGAWLAQLIQSGLKLSSDCLPVLGKGLSLAATCCSAFLVRNLTFSMTHDRHAADFSGVLFLLTPLIAVTGVSFQNEAWAVLGMLGCLGLLLSGCENDSAGRIAAAGFVFGLTLAARIHFGFFLAPAFWILFKYQKVRRKGIAAFLLALAAASALWIGWFWILEKREGAVLTSLFSQSGEGRIASSSILSDPAFYKSAARQLLLYWAHPFVWLFSFAVFFQKERRFLWVWLIASFSVLVLLPRKVLDHPFYLIGGVPPFIMLTGPAIYSFCKDRPLWLRNAVMALLLTVSIVFFMRSQRLPHEARAWLNQAREISASAGKSNPVVMQHSQAAAMLFYSHQPGWSFDLNMEQSDVMQSAEKRHRDIRSKGYGNLISWIEYLRSQGAKRLVITDQAAFETQAAFAAHVRSRYPEKKTESGVLLFDLRS